ncbi:MAG: hypothetical protein AAF558_04275 [Verrucomicrobiota bacterium]
MKHTLLLLFLFIVGCSSDLKTSGYVDYIIFEEADGSKTAYMTEEFKDLANLNRRGEPPFVQLSDQYIEISIPAYSHVKPFTISSDHLVKIQWKD